jgi:predicted transport protein
MSEKAIKINPGVTLPEVVSSIRKGEWKIPRFQREFVWEKSKVIELLDSMYKEFPIGSFFLWIPPEDYAHYYKDIPELNIETGNRRFYTHFILDGQQRLTSLYAVYRGLEISGFDYSKICFDLDTHKFNVEDEDNERNISIHVVLNEDKFLKIYNNLTDERKKNIMTVKDKLKNYPFPVITIEDKNIEEACKIFERINQGGKRLSIFDLVVAVTWDKDFELKQEIDKFNKEIEDSFGKIDYEVFSETLSLIINKQCTKAFQLKLTPSDVKEKWSAVKKAIGKSIQFCRSNLKVRNYRYLPYRDMIALIAYYYYECSITSQQVDKSFLEEWFWKVAFSNRYSGSSFNKIGEDRAYLFDRKIRNESIEINYDINITEEKIKTLNMGRRTALRNAIFLILIQKNPLSFRDNSPIDIEKDPISTFNDSEKHHIFPKAYLKSVGISEKKTTNLLVNFCLIDSELNKNISDKQPSQYFSSFQKINPDLNKSLKSHLIPDDENSGIWGDNYQKFIDQRTELILREVKKRIGNLSAKVEEEMATNPAKLIQRTEQKIREHIIHTLYDAIGEDWWNVDKVVPQDVAGYVKAKIKKERANKPYIADEEWDTTIRKLEQVNIMDYLKIIITNWNLFEDTFGSKKSLERYFDGFSTIRNQIDHIKTIDVTERKFGETSVEWLLRCIKDKDDKDDMTEDSGIQMNALYLNELYEKLKTEVLSLDSEIEELKRKHYNAFNKRNNMFHFVVLKFRQTHIVLTVSIKKGTLNDPKKISIDCKDNAKKERCWYKIKLKSMDEIPDIIEIIKQAYDYNEEYITGINRQKKPRHFARLEFWKGLLEEAKRRNADFQNLSPTTYHWLGKGGGKSGVSFNFNILTSYAGIELYLDCGDKTKNKARYDLIFKHKNEIENIFANTLSWERLDNKRASRIAYRIEGKGLNDKEEWTSIQKELVDIMMKLEKAMKPVLKLIE